jgi:glyoxylase-like metal-dependent hydrolase (beta-lactamase superfamily II)
LFRYLTPVYLNPADSLVNQLKQQGISAFTVKTIIVSHFHVDHIGGLADFPDAHYIFLAEAYRAVQGTRGFAALRAGYLPGHLPANFETRVEMIDTPQLVPLPSDFTPFERGYDILGDGSIWGVPLPGHAHGQMGLFLQTSNLGQVFLAADACWHSRSYQELILPHRLVNLIHPAPAAYRMTVQQLHRLYQRNTGIHIIPSHCPEAATTYLPLTAGNAG